jgi:hypothetical protein
VKDVALLPPPFDVLQFSALNFMQHDSLYTADGWAVAYHKARRQRCSSQGKRRSNEQEQEPNSLDSRREGERGTP